MPLMTRFRLADTLLLLLTIALAGGARAAYLLQYADTAGPLVVQTAPPEQEELTAGVRDHGLLLCRAPLAATEEATAYVAPGYPWLLGSLGRLPIDASAQPSLVHWLQCGLGTLTAALYFLFARRAFQSLLVAGMTGVLCALHPFWIVNTAALADGVLATFLLAASVFLGARGGQVGGALTSLLFGLALAALALVRAALLPFAAAALLWFLLRCRRQSHGWLAALLASLGFLTALAPWTLRNLATFHDVFPIVDSTYLHLSIGNNPRATGGPQPEESLIEALAAARGESTSATTEWLAQLDEPARYRALAEPTVREIVGNPLATLQRRLMAGLGFFLGDDWLTQHRLWRDLPEGGSAGPFPVWLTASLIFMLVLAPLGWRWSFGWRRESMPASLAAIWIPLAYLLSHADALSGPRLPLDGVLLCYAAFALCCAVPRIGGALLRGSSTDAEPS
jgi:hypothetical protein